jgi:hypothetical protein
MDLDRVKILLERYWNCASTIEEENELRVLLNSEDVPSELEESAALFKYFESQRQTTLDNKFDDAIVDKIKHQKTPILRSLNSGLQNYMRVAAAVLVIIAASLVFRMEMWQGDRPSNLLVEDTYKTPEEAYEETKRAFMLIAEKMNSGRKQAEKIGILNKAENKIKTDIK